MAITKNQRNSCTKCGRTGTLKNDWVCYPHCNEWDSMELAAKSLTGYNYPIADLESALTEHGFKITQTNIDTITNLTESMNWSNYNA